MAKARKAIKQGWKVPTCTCGHTVKQHERPIIQEAKKGTKDKPAVAEIRGERHSPDFEVWMAGECTMTRCQQSADGCQQYVFTKALHLERKG